MMDAEEVRREFQKKLGEEFGTIYYALWNEWARCQQRSAEFGKLFGSSKDVALLDAISNGEFIGWIQNILWDDLLISICRLTDRPNTGGDNLTVLRLPDFCKDPELSAEVKKLSEKARHAAKFARGWRDKRIAHTDLEQATKPNATPLAKATRLSVAEALDAVHATLDAISVQLMKTEASNNIIYPEGARSFISFARILSDVIQFMDSSIDPSGKERLSNTEVACEFLRKLRCELTFKNVEKIIMLRQAASRFRGGEPV